MNRLLISAAHKSSGKTIIAAGMCAALAARGLLVQPFKKGPDYIDPMWLGRAAARPCHNLDFYTMAEDEIHTTFSRYGMGADVVLVEGNKGLHDGLDTHGADSNAALAKLLHLPVVLVLDARGMTRGVAPLVLGYQRFDSLVNIAGIVLNRVGGDRHEAKVRAAIEHYTDLPVLGAVREDPELQIVERHLGLIPANELTRADRTVRKLVAAVTGQIDLDLVLESTGAAPPLEHSLSVSESVSRTPNVRIGIARDAAFGFYYPGDLTAMRQAGAELLPFDTMREQALPPVDGLFIGGGFPEMHGDALERNLGMRASIRGFVDAGGPVYAECGGLMYLTRSLAWQGQTRSMVGALPADAVMQQRPAGRGYVRLRETRGLWPSAGDGAEFPAHEFHYSRLENIGTDVEFAFEVLRGHGIDGAHDGMIYKNVLATYAHQRDTGRNRWARRYVAHVRTCKHNRTAALAVDPIPGKTCGLGAQQS